MSVDLSNMSLGSCYSRTKEFFFLLVSTDELLKLAQAGDSNNIPTEQFKKELINRAISEPEKLDIPPELVDRLFPQDGWRVRRFLDTGPSRKDVRWLLNTSQDAAVRGLRDERNRADGYKRRFGHCPIALMPDVRGASWVRSAAVLDLYLSDADPRDPHLIRVDGNFQDQIDRAKQILNPKTYLPEFQSIRLLSTRYFDSLFLIDASAGLAIAVSLHLLARGQELSMPVVFSASLDSHLGMKPVDGLNKKRQAARDMGYLFIGCADADAGISDSRGAVFLRQTATWEDTWSSVCSALEELQVSIRPSSEKWTAILKKLDKVVHLYKPYEIQSKFEQIRRVADDVFTDDDPVRDAIFTELDGCEGRLLIHAGRQPEGIQKIERMVDQLERNEFDRHYPSHIQRQSYALFAPLLDLLADPATLGGWVGPLLSFRSFDIDQEYPRLGAASLWFYLKSLWNRFLGGGAAGLFLDRSLNCLTEKYSVESWYVANVIEKDKRLPDPARTRNDWSVVLAAAGQYDKAASLFQEDRLGDLFSWTYYTRVIAWKAWAEQDSELARSCLDLLSNEGYFWFPWPQLPMECECWFGKDHWHLAANQARSAMLSYAVLGKTEEGLRLTEHAIRALQKEDEEQESCESIPALAFRLWSAATLSYYLWPDYDNRDRRMEFLSQVSTTHALIKEHSEYWQTVKGAANNDETRREQIHRLLCICYY